MSTLYCRVLPWTTVTTCVYLGIQKSLRILSWRPTLEEYEACKHPVNPSCKQGGSEQCFRDILTQQETQQEKDKTRRCPVYSQMPRPERQKVRRLRPLPELVRREGRPHHQGIENAEEHKRG